MCTAVSSTKSNAILRPSGDQYEKKLGTRVSRRWCVPSGLAAQMLKSPSWIEPSERDLTVLRPFGRRRRKDAAQHNQQQRREDHQSSSVHRDLLVAASAYELWR